MENYEVLSFENWQVHYETEQEAKAKTRGRGHKSAKPYNPEFEPPPERPWFQMDKPHIDAQIRAIAEKVLQGMRNARAHDKELMFLRKAAYDIGEVARKDSKNIAIVGQQAMGKSLLINALLHRRNLSKTSASGSACTASVIKYLHKAGANDLDEVYNAAIQFMDDNSLRETAEEHARRYHHFHFSNKVDPEYFDEEQRSALTAAAFFHLIYNADYDDEAAKRLGSILNPTNIKDGSLLRDCIRMAHRRINETGANEHGIIELRNLNAETLLESVESFVAQHETKASLWPIVQHVNVFMGSALLRNYVNIIDLPGKSNNF